MVMAAMVVWVVAPLTMVRPRHRNSWRIASAVPIAAWIGLVRSLGSSARSPDRHNPLDGSI